MIIAAVLVIPAATDGNSNTLFEVAEITVRGWQDPQHRVVEKALIIQRTTGHSDYTNN